jgi:hypothetical protein
MQVPEVKSKLVVQGLYPVGTCGADFAAYIRERYDDYGRIIREAIRIRPHDLGMERGQHPTPIGTFRGSENGAAARRPSGRRKVSLPETGYLPAFGR